MTLSTYSARSWPGFDPVAAQVLRHLVRQDGVDAVEIADTLGLDPAAVTTALTVLERERLVVRADGRWAALPPRSGLATVLARRRAELAGWEQHVDDLEAEYWASADRRAMRGLVEHVTGPDQVGAVYDQLVGSAAREILHLAKPPYVSAAGPFGTDSDPQLRPGLSVRSVYDASGLDDPLSALSAVAGTKHGGQMRLHVAVPTKLVVVDQQIALLPRDDDASAGSVVVRVPGVVSALVALFESLWRSATPLNGLSATPAPSTDGLPGRSREVLHLMAAGLTDDAIAHALGVSRRTVQKTVSDLAVVFGARTRFQIALVAAERGLVARTEH